MPACLGLDFWIIFVFASLGLYFWTGPMFFDNSFLCLHTFGLGLCFRTIHFYVCMFGPPLASTFGLGLCF